MNGVIEKAYEAGGQAVFDNCPDIDIVADLAGQWSNPTARTVVLPTSPIATVDRLDLVGPRRFPPDIIKRGVWPWLQLVEPSGVWMVTSD